MWAWFASLLTGGIGSAVSGILAPILGYFTTARNDDLSGFQAGAIADSTRYVAYLNASVQMAQLKASQNLWWGARLIFLALGTLVTYHFGAVVLDSTPSLGHVVGSWKVASLPYPLDEWEGSIVLSFFIIAPAAPIASAVTAWFHRAS